jgi:hypothetical protein
MRVALGVALAALLAACGAAPTTGFISLRTAYLRPPAGAAISIGGYAAFARLVGPDGSLLFSGEINPIGDKEAATNRVFEVEPGDYALEVTVRAASDAIGIDQNGVVHRDFGPATTTCAATIPVSGPDQVDVVVSLIGGDFCEIGPAG